MIYAVKVSTRLAVAVLAAALVASAHADTLGGQTVYPLQRAADGSSTTTPDSINAEDSTKTALPPATVTPPSPPPPPPPANCTVNPGETKSWTVSSFSCTGMAAIGSTSVTVTHGALQAFNDTTTSHVGRSSYICDNGTLLPYNDGNDVPSCRQASDCTIDQYTGKGWIIGGKVCSGSAKVAGPGADKLPASGIATIPHEGTWKFSDIWTPVTGMATFTCNDGVLSSYPLAGATCTQVPLGSDCVLPTYSTLVSWTVGGYACSSAFAPTPEDDADGVNDPTINTYFIHHNTTKRYIKASVPPAAGVASYRCMDGALKTTPEAGAACSPTTCSVAAGVTRTWTVGTSTCSATTTAAATIVAGNKLLMTDASADPAKGTAEFLCSAGTLSATPVAGTADCSATFTPCSVVAGASFSWMNPAGTRSCAGTVAAATSVAHGSNLRVTDATSPGVGVAYFACLNGVLQSTANTAKNLLCKP